MNRTTLWKVGPMKPIAKWILIIWSIFCLVGVVGGIANVGKTMQDMKSSDQGIAGVGVGCGMALWVGIWAAIALPALVIYLVAGKREPLAVNVLRDQSVRLCNGCGRYYEGTAAFCPNCGKAVGA